MSSVSGCLHIGQRDGAIRPRALELRRVESQLLRTLARGWGDSQAWGLSVRGRRLNWHLRWHGKYQGRWHSLGRLQGC